MERLFDIFKPYVSKSTGRIASSFTHQYTCNF